MIACIHTAALSGIDVLDIDVEVQLSGGLPAFTVVGLPDKAVAESRERVRAALTALGLSLPPKRITVNLSPADIIKEGSHYDLPIALGLMAAIDVFEDTDLAGYIVMGELSLDARIRPVSGILPAAIRANERGMALVCPEGNGPEATWAGDVPVIAAPTLLHLINHIKGTTTLPVPERPDVTLDRVNPSLDMKDIKGQETAKRAMEIAAAGGHNIVMIGPPGSGKSMLAQRLPGLLPPLTPGEALDVSLIRSVSGDMTHPVMSFTRPFRSPHHGCSAAALVGGGPKAKPGEISLAHMGVLFLDELPEFGRHVLDALRAPMETGQTTIARANRHLTYPSRFQVVAAMNPCKCGYFADPDLACRKVPHCGRDYQSKISGPILDRIDLYVDVPQVKAQDLALPTPSEGSQDIAARVAVARAIQTQRYGSSGPRCNAEADGADLTAACILEPKAQSLLETATHSMKLSARGYHRVLRVARTIADLSHDALITGQHLSEALSYRRTSFK